MLLQATAVYAWGNNDNGQLGIGKKTQRELTPTLLPITEKIVQIAATGKGGAALTEDGHVYTWGNGNLNAELKAEGESAGDTDHKLQECCKTCISRKCIYSFRCKWYNIRMGRKAQFMEKKFHQRNLVSY